MALADDARAIAESAIRAVRMDRLMRRVPWQEWTLRPVEEYRSVRVVAFGKGAMAMAGAAEEGLGRRVHDGIAVVPHGYAKAVPADMPVPRVVEVIKGDHPLAGQASVRAGERVLEIANACTPDDLLLVLVSGGGTALCAAFAAGISLEDARETFRMLLESGADIHAMNVVRKHLSRIGGGRLAAASRGDVLALVVSDVIGDDLSVIASGPTVPDPSKFDDALEILQRFGLWDAVPASVRAHLDNGLIDPSLETPKPGATILNRIRTRLVGTNRTALAAAADAASKLGYDTRIVRGDVSGEAREVGGALIREALTAPLSRPTCLLWGGETTVTVRGSGHGGRNQELALAAGIALDRGGRDCVLLSIGTDGRDGPTDAAGAWVSNQTMALARESGLAPEVYLANNDAYTFFGRVGTLVRTGPTHANVMDLQIVVVGGVE